MSTTGVRPSVDHRDLGQGRDQACGLVDPIALTLASGRVLVRCRYLERQVLLPPKTLPCVQGLMVWKTLAEHTASWRNQGMSEGLCQQVISSLQTGRMLCNVDELIQATVKLSGDTNSQEVECFGQKIKHVFLPTSRPEQLWKAELERVQKSMPERRFTVLRGDEQMPPSKLWQKVLIKNALSPLDRAHQQKVIDFALGAVPQQFPLLTTGALRNAAQLHAAGQPYLSYDDDIFWRGLRSHERMSTQSTWSLSARRPGHEWHFAESRDALISKHKGLVEQTWSEPVDMQVWLGRSMKDLMRRKHPRLIETPDAQALSYWKHPKARVAIVVAGTLGEPGFQSPHSFLSLPDTTLFQLFAGQQERVEKRLSERCALRVSPDVHVSNVPWFMSAVFAAHAGRDVLPPFPPWLRGQDGVWRVVHHLLYPEHFVAHLPSAWVHQPQDQRGPILKGALLEGMFSPKPEAELDWSESDLAAMRPRVCDVLKHQLMQSFTPTSQTAALVKNGGRMAALAHKPVTYAELVGFFRHWSQVDAAEFKERCTAMVFDWHVYRLKSLASRLQGWVQQERAIKQSQAKGAGSSAIMHPGAGRVSRLFQRAIQGHEQLLVHLKAPETPLFADMDARLYSASSNARAYQAGELAHVQLQMLQRFLKNYADLLELWPDWVERCRES